MRSGTGLGLVLVVLVATNVWVHLGPRRAHLVTGPLAAGALLLLGRAAGLTWGDLGLAPQTMIRGAGYAAVSAAVVGVGYAVAIFLPFTRAWFRDTRYQVGPASALYLTFVAIPLATVVFEECAFRGALWGLLARDFGVRIATTVSAVLFGLWHVLPALDLARTNTAVQGDRAPSRSRLLVTVLATVAFTTVAGLLFAELRRRSGSLLAPIGLHWATNGMGVLAAAWVWSLSSRRE
jgi:membrane protease YdiL (CAAX protease family)